MLVQCIRLIQRLLNNLARLRLSSNSLLRARLRLLLGCSVEIWRGWSQPDSFPLSPNSRMTARQANAPVRSLSAPPRERFSGGDWTRCQCMLGTRCMVGTWLPRPQPSFRLDHVVDKRVPLMTWDTLTLKTLNWKKMGFLCVELRVPRCQKKPD
jgi:hypothetical protein